MDGWGAFCAKWLPWVSLPLLLVPPVLGWALTVAFEQLANRGSWGGSVAFPLILLVGLLLAAAWLMLMPMLFLGNVWAAVLLVRAERSVRRTVRFVLSTANALLLGGLIAAWAAGGFRIAALLPR